MRKVLALACMSFLASCGVQTLDRTNSDEAQGRAAGQTSPALAPESAPCSDKFADGTRPQLLNPKLARETQFLCFSAFATLHSGVSRTPLYSAEHLTSATVTAAEMLDGRDNRFHAEDRLPPAARSELSDYRGSGYDRGHMAPSGDMPTREADYESFSLANIVPHAPELNRRSWSRLESEVRNLASQFGRAYIVTGPLFEGEDISQLSGRVLVPTATWKAIYVPGQGAGAWIASNSADPEWQVMSIDQFTRRTGIDPFPTIPPAMKAKRPDLPIPIEHE